MMLPIEIQMQIDLSAQHHSRAIAEGFAKLRAELGPQLARVYSNLQAQMLLNAAHVPYNVQQMLELRPCNQLMPSNAAMMNAGMVNGGFYGTMVQEAWNAFMYR